MASAFAVVLAPVVGSAGKGLRSVGAEEGAGVAEGVCGALATGTGSVDTGDDETGVDATGGEETGTDDAGVDGC